MQLIMRKSLKCLVLPFALLMGGATINPLAAQFFTPPVATDFPFNTVKVQTPTMTSNYSRNLGSEDIYLSTWNTHTPGGESEFMYMFTTPDNPAVVLTQGSFTYKDVSDLEVGLYWDANVGDYVVPVAYYQNNVGHMLDLYQVTGSGLVMISTMQLSNSNTYGRIRMDSHNGYGIVIAWEHPGPGIHAMVCESGNWSGVTHFLNTVGETAPDVAFSHISSGSSTLNVRLVYTNPANQTITTASVAFPTLQIPPPGGMAAAVANVEDMITIPGNISNVSLDCPDHYHTDNWAYAFTDGEQVFVRYWDQMSMGTPQTRIVNDGSLGNAPTFNGNNTAYTPTLHYGDSEYQAGGYTGQIKVGWYNVDNVASGPFIGNGQYIGIKMRENGGTLMSDPDYMGISQSALPVTADFHSGISFSKMGEGHWASAPQFMYTTYFVESSPGSQDYELRHAFHRWNNTHFKGENPPTPKRPECAPDKAHVTEQVLSMNVYPNPFKTTLTNNVTMTAEGSVELTLTDISGRQVAAKKVNLNKGRHMVQMKDLGQLLPGTYFLNSTVNGKNIGVRTVIKL